MKSIKLTTPDPFWFQMFQKFYSIETMQLTIDRCIGIKVGYAQSYWI